MGDETVVVYDGLDSNDGTAALSARQGKILNDKNNALAERVENLENAGSGSGSDTTFTPAVDADIDALFE